MNSFATHKKVRWAIPVLALAVVLFLPGCDGLADLDVDNKNAPNQQEALANPSDVVSLQRVGTLQIGRAHV